MITREMIESGYKQGYVRLIDNPNDNCVAAQIGTHWFYFADIEDQIFQAEEYKKMYADEVIVDQISSTLDDFFKREFEDEYLYYYHYLSERI